MNAFWACPVKRQQGWAVATIFARTGIRQLADRLHPSRTV